MNRAQKRQKPLPKLQEMRVMWNALDMLATANGDTILRPKLDTWRPYVAIIPKIDKEDQVYKAIKKCFKTTEKEVEMDMKRGLSGE